MKIHKKKVFKYIESIEGEYITHNELLKFLADQYFRKKELIAVTKGE